MFDIRHLTFDLRQSDMHSINVVNENLLKPACSYLILDEFKAKANQSDYSLHIDSYAKLSNYSLFCLQGKSIVGGD